MTLESWRKANCYSQAAFARLLKEKAKLKIDRTTVWYWERGVKPRKDAAEAISLVTGGQVTLENIAP